VRCRAGLCVLVVDFAVGDSLVLWNESGERSMWKLEDQGGEGVCVAVAAYFDTVVVEVLGVF
jgi:hypothetical protein